MQYNHCNLQKYVHYNKGLYSYHIKTTSPENREGAFLIIGCNFNDTFDKKNIKTFNNS